MRQKALCACNQVSLPFYLCFSVFMFFSFICKVSFGSNQNSLFRYMTILSRFSVFSLSVCLFGNEDKIQSDWLRGLKLLANGP